jgi:hypothetical protein
VASTCSNKESFSTDVRAEHDTSQPDNFRQQAVGRPRLAFIGHSPHQAIAVRATPGLLALLDRVTNRFAASSFSALHLACGKLIVTYHWCSSIMLSNHFQLDTRRRQFSLRLDDPPGLIQSSAPV